MASASAQIIVHIDTAAYHSRWFFYGSAIAASAGDACTVQIGETARVWPVCRSATQRSRTWSAWPAQQRGDRIILPLLVIGAATVMPLARCTFCVRPLHRRTSHG